MNSALIALGKSLSALSKLINRGSGSTWPGHIALSANPNFIRDILKKNNTTTILIAGTNGKTTTAKLIQEILEKDGKTVFRNEAGANLLNGIASALIQHSSLSAKISAEYAILEIDENALPHALGQIDPDYLVLLNLFRDQLDRYGETDAIATKWKKSLSQLPETTTLVLNADDPQIAFLGKGLKQTVQYFGLSDKKLAIKVAPFMQDAAYCPNCGTKLSYEQTYFSHIGIWHCNKCKLNRPIPTITSTPLYPLPGVYNRYNTLSAVLVARDNNVSEATIEKSFKVFKPAFGRQEIIETENKKVQLFLSKNPTSFNESLRTIKELGAKNILIILNDRIPDGRDVSWIWDIDIEGFLDPKITMFVSGDRAYDMGLRVKYAIPSGLQITNYELRIEEDVEKAIHSALDKTSKSETLYILPTYSAMLEVRKILTGKKIL